MTGVSTSDYNLLSMRIDARWDVAGARGSYMVTSTIEYGTPLSRTTFGWRLGACRVRRRRFRRLLLQHRSGGAPTQRPVGHDNARDGFRRAGINFLASQAITGDLTSGLSAVAVVGYYRVLGDFKQSPVVSEAGSADQFIAGLGLTYTF